MKQKVGLLVDSLQVSKQIKDFIDLSLTSNNYEISTIIVNNSSILSEVPRKKIFKYIQRKGFSKFINKVFFIILNRLEKKIISKKLIYKNFYNIYKLPESDFEIIKVKTRADKDTESGGGDDDGRGTSVRWRGIEHPCWPVRPYLHGVARKLDANGHMCAVGRAGRLFAHP